MGKEVSKLPPGRMERVKSAEVRAAIMRLRSWGASVEVIAGRLDMDEATVEKMILDEMTIVSRVSATEILARHQRMLGDIFESFHTGVQAGDDKAAKVVLAAMDHQAKLHGSYAASKVAIQTEDTFDSSAAALLNDLGATIPEHEVIDAEGWTED